MGAPWHYGISDVRSLADKAVATILENVKVADLHRAYWPTQSLDAGDEIEDAGRIAPDGTARKSG